MSEALFNALHKTAAAKGDQNLYLFVLRFPMKSDMTFCSYYTHDILVLPLLRYCIYSYAGGIHSRDSSVPNSGQRVCRHGMCHISGLWQHSLTSCHAIELDCVLDFGVQSICQPLGARCHRLVVLSGVLWLAYNRADVHYNIYCGDKRYVAPSNVL